MAAKRLPPEVKRLAERLVPYTNIEGIWQTTVKVQLNQYIEKNEFPNRVGQRFKNW
jgi:hypothetical protein